MGAINNNANYSNTKARQTVPNVKLCLHCKNNPNRVILPMKIFSFFIVFASLFSLSLFAQDLTPSKEKLIPETGKLVPDTKEFNPTTLISPVQSNEEGIALDGFDTVAYFKQERAIRGTAQFSCEYQNKTWYFSSAENREAFLANPEDFIPQYGGYCAHSLSNDKLVRSNPESFSIRDNKLYLYVNDNVAKKDLEKKENIFANHSKKRKKNWFKYESSF